MRKTKIKIIAGLVILGTLLTLAFIGLMVVNDFFNKHYFIFNQPIVVRFNPPIELKERKIEIKEVVKEIKNLPEPKTDLEKYICEKFGVADCKIALAIAKAESGMKETAFNLNSDGSIDIGIFQINSIHWGKEGCQPKNLFDGYKNVDCAYKIWKAQGWEPWTTFKVRSYLKHL